MTPATSADIAFYFVEATLAAGSVALIVAIAFVARHLHHERVRLVRVHVFGMARYGEYATVDGIARTVGLGRGRLGRARLARIIARLEADGEIVSDPAGRYWAVTR